MENIVYQFVSVGVTLLIAIAGYFLKRTVDDINNRMLRAESDNRELERAMADMRANYMERFGELKDLIHAGQTEILKQLADGAVTFRGIESDVSTIKDRLKKIDP